MMFILVAIVLYDNHAMSRQPLRKSSLLFGDNYKEMLAIGYTEDMEA